MTASFYCYKDLCVPEWTFKKASNETVKELLSNGWGKKEFDLIECLEHGYEAQAVLLYDKMHNCGIKKSREMIRKIAHDMGLE